MTLLQERDRARQQRRLVVLAETRRRLKAALANLVPGQKVIVFGSLTKPGVFNDCSDIDLALESEPARMTAGQLGAMLSEELQLPVDIVLLSQCRFREKIAREGEIWIG